MAIASDYSVHFTSGFSPGWNYGLAMSGNARLSSAGGIDLSQMNPANIAIAGGAFDAAGAFKAGGPVRMSANVNAGSLTLGTGPAFQITGNMVSRGAVWIASSATIDGAVSGTRIGTDSSVTINGPVTASDVLTLGSHATIRGPVSGATSITIDSPSSIVGTLRSQGVITIGSHANIDGAISGAVVTTSSPVTLKGDIVATRRFTLASGSTVAGNITAPEIDMYAAGSVVTGKVTAEKYLTMGHAVRINGDVDTGRLKLEASDALIAGDAAVDFATLFWHGRVSKKIFCKSGTRPGYCDCVDNQSGYPVNTANGPRCEAASPPPNGLHHFLITHDGSAGTCTVEYVRVSACANADCSTLYNGGATVTMAPGGATVVIDASGVNSRAPVSRIATGTVDLALTQDGAKPPLQCFDGRSNSCAMAFTGGANFSIQVPDHKAGNTVTAIVKALKANDSQSACVPAFTDEKPVQYRCDYLQPASGAAALALATNAGATGSFACDAGMQLKTKFDEHGVARVGLRYPDAGKLALEANFEAVKGSTEFVVAPDHFVLKEVAPLRAGADFTVEIEARNNAGEPTPNFDAATLPPDATKTEVALDCLAAGMAGSLTPGSAHFAKGKARATLNFSEAGYLDLRAAHAGFLGSKIDTAGSTGGSAGGACQAKAGPFVPAYFQVELNDAARKAANFYYSGEPIPLRLSARNAQGGITRNYPAGHGSDDVIRFSAVRPAGAALEPGLGAVSGSFEARHFVSGEAPQPGAAPGAAIARPAFTFANALTAPTRIRLRADNEHPDPNQRITSVHAGAEPELAQPTIRTGRLRLGKRFGRVGAQPLELPLTAQYWSGKSWVLNSQDGFTVIPGAAFAQQSGGDGAAKPAINTLPDVALVDGAGILPVTGNVPGWIDIAVNLGPPGQPDTSCLAAHPASSGAGLAWLRSPAGCNGQPGAPADPSARATFGVFPIENRRIIHVREVFN